MDFDLHFGRFFGPKIDVFEKFLLPDFELQLEVRSAKIVILPRENAVFYKIDILALKWQPMKNIKKTGKTSLRNQVVFSHWFFLDFGANLDGFWPPSWTPQNWSKLPFFQVAAKRRPRGAQEAPRASQGRLKSLQQPPKRAQECPRAIKTCPGHAQSASRGSLFWGFSCFSMFFCVFMGFPVFLCVFLGFFCVFLQRTPVNFSTLSSKLNCVRQQAKASKSKQKQAKGSQSKQEPARV